MYKKVILNYLIILYTLFKINLVESMLFDAQKSSKRKQSTTNELESEVNITNGMI